VAVVAPSTCRQALIAAMPLRVQPRMLPIVSPMLHWLEYDPIAITVLIVGIGMVSLLALSM
jgi:hypothetical protein